MEHAVFILVMEPIAGADGSARPLATGMTLSPEQLPRNALEWLREGGVLAWPRSR